MDEVINKEIIINWINITIQAAAALNEKYLVENNINTNLSIIVFTECEKKKGFDKPFIISKTELTIMIVLFPKLNFFNNSYTNEKIDLSIFKNDTIYIYIPFNISQYII